MAEQRVEADQVVHMGMGDQRRLQPQQAAGGQHVQVAQVEDQRAALEGQFDIEGGLAEAAVHQEGMAGRAHRWRRAYATAR